MLLLNGVTVEWLIGSFGDENNTILLIQDLNTHLKVSVIVVLQESKCLLTEGDKEKQP